MSTAVEQYSGPEVEPRWKVTGAWTQAGIASCLRLEGSSKKDSILLDCGLLDASCISTPLVLITHGHIDHVGACISHARARSLSQAPATYIIPVGIEASLRDAQRAFEAMNEGGPIPMNIICLSPGESYMHGTDTKIAAFETTHRVASQGYALYTISKGRLLPECKDMTGAELRELKGLGVAIASGPVETLQLAYTGDTTFEAFLKPVNHFLFTVPTLIMEVTYIDGDRAKALQYGHIHLEDLLDHADSFQNRFVLLMHLSVKYSCSRALDVLSKELPSALMRRTGVALHSFGSGEAVTMLNNPRWAQNAQSTAGWGWSNSNGAAYTRNINYRGKGAGGGGGGGGRRRGGGYDGSSSISSSGRGGEGKGRGRCFGSDRVRSSISSTNHGQNSETSISTRRKFSHPSSSSDSSINGSGSGGIENNLSAWPAVGGGGEGSKSKSKSESESNTNNNNKTSYSSNCSYSSGSGPVVGHHKQQQQQQQQQTGRKTAWSKT